MADVIILFSNLQEITQCRVGKSKILKTHFQPQAIVSLPCTGHETCRLPLDIAHHGPALRKLAWI
jgi:hypothetical protein